MAQVARSPKTYDVCVIGSGAGGGMAAKILTEGGLECRPAGGGAAAVSRQRLTRCSCGLTNCHIAVWGLVAARQKTSENFLRQMARGRLRASPTFLRPAPTFSGFVRALWVVVQTTGAHRSAFCSDRFQIEDARRHWGRLADHLRRYRALLR